uniref:Uncharacterized protein n=1 Tax=Arundo donax TaxID=35708 RepID=A0A0A8ZUM5_ARUDO
MARMAAPPAVSVGGSSRVAGSSRSELCSSTANTTRAYARELGRRRERRRFRWPDPSSRCR